MKIDTRLIVRQALMGLMAITLVACGGNNSTSGAGKEPVDPGAIEPNLTTAVTGPNLNGDDWAGYYKTATGNYINLTATIRHEGTSIIVRTSIDDSEVAGKLQGNIDSVGRLLLYDLADGEDWTTLYGPASANSINLADYVFVDGHKVDTNVIILKRNGAATQ